MSLLRSFLPSAAGALCLTVWLAAHSQGAEPRKIVLIAGETAKVDAPGHHDYLAGCACLDALLRQTVGVQPTRVNDGWPTDESLFDGAGSVVFYTDGGGKQALLQSPERIQKVQSLADRGVGLVMIHQAVDFPDEFAEQGRAWLGGVYQKDRSGRGHWPSSHVEFPRHAISHGVQPWQINDGWLNGIQFVDRLQGVIPLVWSSKDFPEGRPGLDAQIVGWGYERPQGGRSFCFTGLDAHSAWELPGVRQLLVNGVLWSAGVDIPAEGAPCRISKEELDSFLTPRLPKTPAKKTPAP